MFQDVIMQPWFMRKSVNGSLKGWSRKTNDLPAHLFMLRSFQKNRRGCEFPAFLRRRMKGGAWTNGFKRISWKIIWVFLYRLARFFGDCTDEGGSSRRDLGRHNAKGWFILLGISRILLCLVPLRLFSPLSKFSRRRRVLSWISLLHLPNVEKPRANKNTQCTCHVCLAKIVFSCPLYFTLQRSLDKSGGWFSTNLLQQWTRNLHDVKTDINCNSQYHKNCCDH